MDKKEIEEIIFYLTALQVELSNKNTDTYKNDIDRIYDLKEKLKTQSKKLEETEELESELDEE